MTEIKSHTDDLKPGSNRSFGLVFAALFLFVGLYPAFHGNDARFWALLLAVALFFVSLARPILLAPLNFAWFKFGMLLAKVMTPVVMFILYLLVVVPPALIMRAMGRDPLALRFDPKADSYWIPRAPQAPASETMRNQF